MCGIAGFYTRSSRFLQDELAKMTNSIAHRGPDASGFYMSPDGCVGLGHRRLSIIDLSSLANQPMFSHTQNQVMVFNGEVYNYNDFKNKYDNTGASWRTHSDSEVILEALCRDGVKAVEQFNGMYALAYYNIQERKLVLLRDRLGVKPLYYFYDNEVFAFASEIKALLAVDYIRQRAGFNKDVLASYLHLGYTPHPDTFYTHIHKVPSGSALHFDGDKIKTEPYWTPEEKLKPNVLNNEGVAKKELNDLLVSSVQYRLISDVPFGTFLSGGTDSSVVTAIASKVCQGKLNTFSIGFKENEYDESKYAAQVAKHLGTDHHEFIVTQQDALEMVDTMMDAYDEPYTDSSAIPTMLVSKLARKHVTMVLSGDGGDELFMGYGMHQWAHRMHRPLTRLLRPFAVPVLKQGGHRYQRVAELMRVPSYKHIKGHIFSQEQYLFTQPEIDLLLKSTNIPFAEPAYNNLERRLSAREKQALFDITHYLKDELLVKVDVASMQFSLEGRTPFLDYRLVEWALNLDEGLKVKKGVSKYILKQVLYDYVPASVFDRPKWGFDIPLKYWLNKELKYLVDTNLKPEVVKAAGIVDNEKVQSLVKAYQAGRIIEYNKVWALMLLHRWWLKMQST